MYSFFIQFGIIIILLCITDARIWPITKSSPISCLISSNKSRSICLSEECITLAHQINERMERSNDPCNDFYTFACGKYLKKRVPVLPDLIKIARVNLVENINALLAEESQQGEPPLVGIVKKARKACISGAGKSLPQFQAMIAEFGGLPMSHKNWNESSFSWLNFYRSASKYGFHANGIFSIYVEADWKDKSRRMIYIDEPNKYKEVYTFTYDHLSVNTIGKSYLSKIALAFGAKDHRVNSRSIGEMLKFGKQLQEEVYKDMPITFETMYNKRTIKELRNDYPNLPWLEIINALIAPKKYTESDAVIVTCTDCIDKLNELIAKTSKRIIANYVVFGFILENIYLLNHTSRDEVLAGLQSSNQQYTLNFICNKLMIKWFYNIIDFQYINKYYDKNQTVVAKTVFQKVIQYARRIIFKTKQYNSTEQRQWALDKADLMKGKFGYEYSIASYDQLEAFYEKVNFSEPSSYIWDMKSFYFTKMYKSLQETTIFKEYMRAAQVNAYYSHNTNTINIPAAFIKELTSDRYPSYINYGRMGIYMAHEITHGFGKNGIEFDSLANLYPWYDNNTLANNEKTARCFARQFSKYYIPDTNIKVKGVYVAQEVQSDNGGYYLSYQTYINMVNFSQDPYLYNLPYTPRQLFWISYASAACEKYDINEVSADSSHPVNHLRVFGGLQNSIEFASDFNCTTQTTMNPTAKCSFWD